MLKVQRLGAKKKPKGPEQVKQNSNDTLTASIFVWSTKTQNGPIPVYYNVDFSNVKHTVNG